MNPQLFFRKHSPLLLVLAVAVLFRVYAIDRLPPGLFGDEAVEGLDALDVLAGNWQIWFHAHLGREPLFVYLVAVSYALFGVTPLATRLPALIAGIATIPAAYWFVREWARDIFQPDRARRLALFTATLVAISFWHIQMTRDAHRGILLPLVEAVEYALLWRVLNLTPNPPAPSPLSCSPNRRGDGGEVGVRGEAFAGVVLGLAIYTYSPGRFVGILIAMFFALELFFAFLARGHARMDVRRALGAGASPAPTRASHIVTLQFKWRGWFVAALCALFVMLPLLLYFAQNPVQFVRRFDSTSVLNAPEPLAALASSVTGNLQMFVIPDAGYQSKHYNLPGKPVFDLFLAPWFFAGLLIALARLKQPQYRFLVLWFAVMLVPAFLTADMIPKGVREFGVVPGVFVFLALAMEELYFRFSIFDFRFRILIAIAILGSTVWTAYDYFVAWANLPTLPAAFDQDYADVAAFVRAQPPNQAVYVSAPVYRHPTFMLLGKQISTARYFDRATRGREFDARAAFIVGANETHAAYVFVRDAAPSAEWLGRIAVSAAPTEQPASYSVFRLAEFKAPQQSLNLAFNPFLKLIGISRFHDAPRGVALYWRVDALPTDRTEMRSSVMFLDSRNQVTTQSAHRLGVPPMDWNAGDVIIEWFETDGFDAAAKFSVQLERGGEKWEVSGNW